VLLLASQARLHTGFIYDVQVHPHSSEKFTLSLSIYFHFVKTKQTTIEGFHLFKSDEPHKHKEPFSLNYLISLRLTEEVY